MEKQNALLQSALWYLSEGFSVVPVKKDKTPLVKWQEYQHKRATEEEITSWWTQWPDANIAVVTGRISDLTVIDWDNKGEALPEGWEYDTPTVASGGGGKHWWFHYQEGVTNKTRFLPFFDIRSEGGYIIAPPSIHASGTPYKWEKPFGPVERMRIPAALLQKMGEGEAKDKEFKKDWNKLLNEGPSQGSRNNDATAVCGKLLFGQPEPDWETVAWPLLQSWNHEKARPPLPESELRVIFDSISSKEKTRRKKAKEVGEPSLAKFGENYVVSVMLSDKFITFEFQDFTIASNKKVAELNITLHCPPDPEVSYPTRIDILSNSNKDLLCRNLKTAFDDKEIKWSLILSQVFDLVNKRLSDESGSICLSEIEDDDTRFVLSPFLEDKAINIIFGDGGIGKSYLALKMGCAVALGSSFLRSTPTLRTNVLYVDYESTPAIFKNRIRSLTRNESGEEASMGELNERLFYFRPNGVPMHDLVRIVRQEMYKRQAGMVIVDSAVFACGGAAEESETAKQLMSALNRLDACVLLIAHETKNNSDEQDKPFGSAFFHNFARNIWRIKGHKEPDDRVTNVALIHTKSNNGMKSSLREARIFFGDGFTDITPTTTELFNQNKSNPQRVLAALWDGPKTLSELAGFLREDGGKEIPINTLSVCLNRLKGRGQVENAGEVWRSIKSDRDKNDDKKTNDGLGEAINVFFPENF